MFLQPLKMIPRDCDESIMDNDASLAQHLQYHVTLSYIMLLVYESNN